MPISLSTATDPSWYSDMSMRIIFFSSPNRYSATALASSVFPTPVGPRNSRTPSGLSKPSLSGPLFRIRRSRHRSDGVLLTDDAFAKAVLEVRKRSETSRKTMSSGMRAV